MINIQGLFLRFKSDKSSDPPCDVTDKEKQGKFSDSADTIKPVEKKVTLEELELECDDIDITEVKSQEQLPKKKSQDIVYENKMKSEDEEICDELALQKATIKETPGAIIKKEKPEFPKMKDSNHNECKEDGKKASDDVRKRDSEDLSENKVQNKLSDDFDCKNLAEKKDGLKDKVQEPQKRTAVKEAICQKASKKRAWLKDELPRLESYDKDKKKKKNTTWKEKSLKILAEYERICRSLAEKAQAPMKKKGPPSRATLLMQECQKFAKRIPSFQSFQILRPNFSGQKPPSTPSRPMKYPYTLSAKIAQFPFRYYFANVWLFKYYLIACVVCLPLFWKLQKMSYSPENVKRWEEIRKRDFSGETH